MAYKIRIVLQLKNYKTHIVYHNFDDFFEFLRLLQTIFLHAPSTLDCFEKIVYYKL